MLCALFVDKSFLNVKVHPETCMCNCFLTVRQMVMIIVPLFSSMQFNNMFELDGLIITHHQRVIC